VTPLVGAVPAPTALRPDPGTARDWLREELSHREYHESLLQRVGHWFDELIGGLRDATTSSGGLGTAIAVVVLVVLATALALLLSRLRRNAPGRVEESTVFSEGREPGGVHRRRAREALHAGRWEEAVVESVRAITSGFFELGLVPEHLDVTVHEVSETGAALFPDQGDRLRATARAFDDTRYGERAATEQQAREAVALDGDLDGLAPDRAGVRGPVSAVPR
jgi:hypothetical protein